MREGVGLTLGGGIVIAIFWSVLIGIIVALIGLSSFGGFGRGRAGSSDRSTNRATTLWTVWELYSSELETVLEAR